MQFDYIIELLNFQDKDFVIDDVKMNTSIDVYVHKDKDHTSTCCKYCGSLNIKINSYYNRIIKYPMILYKPTYIHYKQRRFICCDCNRTFNEDTSLAQKNKVLSNTLILDILKKTKKKESITEISSEVNVSDTTVHNEFNSHIADGRLRFTEAICIDEFRASTDAGEFALIIGDPVSGKILDILPSRKQDYIYHYFQNIPDEERFSIKYVITDLFEPYKTICDTLFWKSTHIADRFHWIRQTTEAFNKIRIRIMNSYLQLGKDEFKGTYNKYTKYANVLKKYWKIFLANPFRKESWYFEEKHHIAYIQEEMNFYEVIEWCCNFDSDLLVSYECLVDLYRIAKEGTFETAKEMLLEWIEDIENRRVKIPELKKVAATYRHWLKPIVNSFIINEKTKAPLTNGFIEGKNNFCKVMKRVAFGFQKFDTMRARILYSNDPDRPFKG